jgi:hypothetical protein
MVYDERIPTEREEGMKFSSIVFMSFLACAAFVVMADGALAGVNYNSSKSNTGSFTFDPTADLDAPKLCADHGGTIKAGPGKLSTCEVPEQAPATPANSK